MPASQAYDVVVVRDPTMTVGAIMTLSRDLAHLTGVKQADVELALQQGRFVVYPGLSQERVDAAAGQLRKMGAVVQVRPADGGAPIQVAEPDPSSMQAARQYGGPVAHFADALDAQAFNTGAGAHPAGRGGYDDGIGQVLPSENAPTSRYVPVPAQAEIPLDKSDRESLTGNEMRALADGLDALSSLDSPQIQTIDGMDGAAFDAAEEAAKKAAVADAPAAPPPPSEDEPQLALDVGGQTGAPQAPAAEAPAAGIPGMPAEQSLQLDRPHAPPNPAQSGPSLPMPSLPQPSYSGARPIPPGLPPSMSSPNMHLDEERGLLFADSVGNTLGLIALASVVSLVIAFAVTKATKQDAVLGLEDELSESYRSPSDVESGKQRAPAAIEAELEELYGSASTRFMLIFVLGIPAGLGLGRIRK